MFIPIAHTHAGDFELNQSYEHSNINLSRPLEAVRGSANYKDTNNTNAASAEVIPTAENEAYGAVEPGSSQADTLGVHYQDASTQTAVELDSDTADYDYDYVANCSANKELSTHDYVVNEIVYEELASDSDK